jgi:lysyl-tRNA synthetase class 2
VHPQKKKNLQIRSRILQVLRNFFITKNYIEIETPVRISAPAIEVHIDAEPSGECYLRTSPELHMKRLLSEGFERIFQIGPCFRAGERGRFHSPEYTMLEWYRTGADYMDILAETKGLLSAVVENISQKTWIVYRGIEIQLMPVWDCITVEDAFIEFAGWNPVTHAEPERFDIDYAEKVIPSLPVNRPVILKDYPAYASAFARLKPGRPEVAERWELFIGGIELANAFSELTDPVEQRRRFEENLTEREKLGKPVYPVDEEFLSALDKGLPECAGVALGVDRLVMLFTDAECIDDVRAF